MESSPCLPSYLPSLSFTSSFTSLQHPTLPIYPPEHVRLHSTRLPILSSHAYIRDVFGRLVRIPALASLSRPRLTIPAVTIQAPDNSKFLRQLDIPQQSLGADECPLGRWAEHIVKAPWGRAREARHSKAILERILSTKGLDMSRCSILCTQDHRIGLPSGCMR
jgi:hypothetical protein